MKVENVVGWEGSGAAGRFGMLCACQGRAHGRDMGHTKAQWIWEVSPLRVVGDASLVGSRAAPQAAWPSAPMGWSGTPGADMK